jgi:EAL domain-containing protein (putative c-di-GMP-specific phosphodiesterase class I)
MEAIAEGVDTAEQAARLREIGCKVVNIYNTNKVGEREIFT